MTGDHVDIIDVTLRDGLQNQPITLAVDDKVRLALLLGAAGLSEIELGSFVHPAHVPQMANTDRVFAGLDGRLPGVRTVALVPNLRGAERALAAGADAIRVVVSCSEGHSRANTRRSVADGLAQARDVVELVAPELAVSVGLATAFVCPFDGDTSVAQVRRIVDDVATWGVTEVSLADTLGKANPAQVATAISTVSGDHPELAIGLHLHNTYGMASANALAGLDAGVRRYDAAVGGIGGCPFAPGAAGNIATEDLVFMLHAMGFSTGIVIDRLRDVVRALAAAVPGGLDSSLPRALRWLAPGDPTEPSAILV